MKNIITTVLVLLIIAALSYPSRWFYVPREVGNWAHLFIFSVPMLFILRGYNLNKFFVFAGFIAAAVLSEFCQKWFCEGRGFEVMDIALDCLGIVTAFFINLLIDNFKMKKLLSIFAAFTLFSSCSISDLTRDLSLSVAMPSVEISTPSVQSGVFSLVREVSVSTIDSIRGNSNVSLTALTFSVVLPDTLTLRHFTHAKFVVSANGQSLTVFDAPISQTGQTFTATTTADITPLLVAARSGNGKLTYSMQVTTNAATPAATWKIATVAAIVL